MPLDSNQLTMLNLMEKILKKFPEMRFLQMLGAVIGNGMNKDLSDITDVFYIEDQELINYLYKYLKDIDR